MSTVDSLFCSVRGRLRSLMTAGEADAAARIIFEDVAGYGRNYLWMNGGRTVEPETEAAIVRVLDKISDGMPVQYAVGKALFMGNYFKVNNSTLIPRPETAGLVDLIIDKVGKKSDLRVLDIGTGSGCIAVELAKALPFSIVEGWDISEDALKVARFNADSLKVHVDFERHDILSDKIPEKTWDIIVSNPPYVTVSEKAGMDSLVLDYEPSGALFVPDSDPLIFYKAITQYASGHLDFGGWLFFEINQRFPSEMEALLKMNGFTNVDIARDSYGAWRYTSGQKL